MSIGNYFDILSKSQKVYSRLLEPVCRSWNLSRSKLDVLLFLYNNPQYDRAAQKTFFRELYTGISEEELLLWSKTSEKVCENIENISKTLTNP